MSKRITPSLVISVIALVVALAGVSYAAIKIPKNSVGAKQLKKNSVTAAKLKKAAVTGAKIKNASVTGSKLSTASVTSSKLGSNSVDASKVIDGSLLRSDFQNGQINGDAYYGERDATTSLNLTNAFQTVVSTPNLPAGSYVLAGRANVVGGAIGDSVIICSMGLDAAQNFTVPDNEVFPLSMASVKVLTAPGQIVMSCNKGLGDPQIAQAYIIATSVNSITGIPPGSD